MKSVGNEHSIGNVLNWSVLKQRLTECTLKIITDHSWSKMIRRWSVLCTTMTIIGRKWFEDGWFSGFKWPKMVGNTLSVVGFLRIQWPNSTNKSHNISILIYKTTISIPWNKSHLNIVIKTYLFRSILNYPMDGLVLLYIYV